MIEISMQSSFYFGIHPFSAASGLEESIYSSRSFRSCLEFAMPLLSLSLMSSSSHATIWANLLGLSAKEFLLLLRLSANLALVADTRAMFEPKGTASKSDNQPLSSFPSSWPKTRRWNNGSLAFSKKRRERKGEHHDLSNDALDHFIAIFGLGGHFPRFPRARFSLLLSESRMLQCKMVITLSYIPSVLDLHIESDRSCFLRASLLIPPIADEMIAYKNHFAFVFSLVDFLFFFLYRALWIWTDKTYSGARLIYDVH